MDAQARKKALFRAKLNAQKKDKRIDSPLVRYNELDQPVCRVCDVVLKSESYWEAHQVSRKHHEAINNIKASAAGLSKVNNAKVEAPKESAKAKPVHSSDMQISKTKQSAELPKSSSELPPDFFDKDKTAKLKTGKDSVKFVEPNPPNRTAGSGQTPVESVKMDSESDELSRGIIPQLNKKQHPNEHSQKSSHTGSETKQVKGALPEGFFDDKEADLRARGVKPVKPDIKDEYKEFEKLIQEDLQEVDNRFEEEEFDAAEMIEEAESVEQKTYREKVELLKRKKTELKAAKSGKRSKPSENVEKESSDDDSSSDDEAAGKLAVDWRAQHL